MTEEPLTKTVEELRGAVSGLHVVCDALVRILFTDPRFEDQRASFIAELNELLEQMPSTLSDITHRNGVMREVIRQFVAIAETGRPRGF